MNKFNNFYKEILYPYRIWVYIGTILIVFWNYIVRELSEILLPITSSIPNNDGLIAIIFLVFPIIFAFLHKEEQIKERHLFSNRYIPEFFFICIYIVLKVSNDYTFYSYSFIEYIGSGLIVLILVELIILAYKIYKSKKNKSNAKPTLEASPFFIDAPTIEDKYDRKKYAKLLIEKIIATKKEKNPEHSFVINIGENYGYGKTSFFLFLSEELKSMTHQSIYFDYKPWLCDSANAIITEFFQTLRNELSPYVTNLDRKIKKYTRLIIQDYTRQIGLSTISSLFETSQTLKEEHDEIANAIKKINMPIIIFIDDVDRLQNDELMVLLKLIRDTADFGNIFYILAADKPFLINSLNSLGIEYPEEYLKKFINYEFTFPANNSAISEFFKDKLSRLFEKYLKKEKERTEKERIFICNFIELNNPFNNMRDIKRFFNNFSFILDTMASNQLLSEIDIKDLFILTLLQYLQPELFKVLRDSNNRILEIKEGTNRYIIKNVFLETYQEKKKKPNYKNITAMITDSYSTNEDLVSNLLKILFAESNNENSINSICRINSYDRYFTTKLEKTQIVTTEVKRIIGITDIEQYNIAIKDIITTKKDTAFIQKMKYLSKFQVINKIDFVKKLFVFIEEKLNNDTNSSLSKAQKETYYFNTYDCSTILYYLFNKKENDSAKIKITEIEEFIDSYSNINLCAIFLNKLSEFYPHPLIFDYENIMKWRGILVERFCNNYITNNNPLDLGSDVLDMIPNLKGHYINGPWDIKFLEYINNLQNYMNWFIPVIIINENNLEWNETYMKQMCWDMRGNLEMFLNKCQHTKTDEKLRDLLNILNRIDLNELDIKKHPFLQYVMDKKQ